MNYTTILNPMETYYQSEASLLQKIAGKLDFYSSIPQVFKLCKTCGLRPGFMLDPDHPAYFLDAIGAHCLSTYDPCEEENMALERCITDKLHYYIELMKIADLTKVNVSDAIWEQYPTDALLRFAWRHRHCNLTIPFYLQKETQTNLSDPFILTTKGNTVTLTQCTHRRIYEVDLSELDFSSFFAHMCRQFQLATESYGYFVPAFVWLCPKKIAKEARHD